MSRFCPTDDEWELEGVEQDPEDISCYYSIGSWGFLEVLREDLEDYEEGESLGEWSHLDHFMSFGVLACDYF